MCQYPVTRGCSQGHQRSLSPHTRTITPKLKLNEAERNSLLFCILKVFFPGNNRTKASTHITLEPSTHAEMNRCVSNHEPNAKELKWECPTNTAQTGHDPSSCIVVHRHLELRSLCRDDLLGLPSPPLCLYLLSTRWFAKVR